MMISVESARMLRRVASLALAAALVVAGCGGGVGVGGTGSFASGPITGFGSVFVNGIEFDDRAARVEDDDGIERGRGVLRLGMIAEVDSGPIGGSADAPTATASRIRIAREIVGPVGVVDVPGARLGVFGQVVAVGADTVFDAAFPAGLESVLGGTVVEVYGFFDAAGASFTATRIAPAGAVSAYRIRGPVRALDSTVRRFSVGLREFDYRSLPADQVPADLADGRFVRLRVATAPIAGRWIVLAFDAALRRPPDVDRVHLRGSVTAFASNAAFSVNGVVVDASRARFPGGSTGLGLGAQVDVDGAASGGVVVAEAVRVRDAGVRENIDLDGAIERVDAAAQSFVLRGVTVTYGEAPVNFIRGTADDLNAGVEVDVRGVLSADGTRVIAQRIRFEN